MQRSFAIDALKIAASQVIVLHHLSGYGPVAPALALEWPRLVQFAFDYGRMAVQVFLVVAGFLAARSLSRKASVDPVGLVAQRYVRLVPIYLVALAWVCVAVAATRGAIRADWLPDPPGAMQVLAHALLVQDIAGQPALSSGVWYVAIDIQLYAMLVAACFAFARPAGATGRAALSACVLLAGAGSLLWFNRDPDLDVWGIYFFGSYSLGVLAGWAKRSRADALFYAAALAAAAIALWVEPRTRIALAGATSLLLVAAADLRATAAPWAGLRARLADSSYALFLSHFGVIAVVSAAWNLSGASGAATAAAAALAAWGGSVLLGLALHARVEVPLSRALLSRAGGAAR